MSSIAIADEWVKTASLFGTVENVIKEALRKYSVDQCQQHINDAASHITQYQQKYQCDYRHFQRSVQLDEDFLMQIESQNPLWEADAMEWEYWTEEQQEWLNRLGDILQR